MYQKPLLENSIKYKEKKTLQEHIQDFVESNLDLEYMMEHYPMQLRYKFKLYLLEHDYYKPLEREIKQ